MGDKQDRPPDEVYLNHAERKVLIGAFGAMSVVMTTGVWLGPSPGSRLAAALAALGLACIAIRAIRRPSLVLDDARLLVRSGVLDRSIDRESIQGAMVLTASVGAFRRSGLFLERRDGTQVNLAKWGIWAGRGSADEHRLLQMADRISRGNH